MLANKSGFKSAQTRFSLLLLEDGEFFLDDFSVHRFLDAVPSAQHKAQGRLKVCTRGFFFEPQDLNLPILRFPFRDMAAAPSAELFPQQLGDVFLSFTTTTVVEMKHRGVDHPYVTRCSSDGASSPTKYVFALLHSRIEDFLRSVEPIWQLAHRKSVLNRVDEELLLAPVLRPRVTDAFDASLLVDFRERPLLAKGKVVDRIVPLLKYPGCLMLTHQRLYFQPAQVNNVGDPVLNWAYDTIEYLYKRRHMLKQTGLEIFLKNGDSFFFSCQSRRDRDELYDMMLSQPDLKRLLQTDVHAMLLKWQRREVSNFEYLRYLNNAAGRTMNDLTQYPVFPWVLRDYKSATLDLTDPAVFRDLSKPVGALNPERLEFYQTRFDAMPRGADAEGLPPPFLYGTHYSTPGYVLYYLVRMAPEYMLCLQNGKFDAPDRLFRSIASTWQSCLTNHADLKELIPAFYDETFAASEWLRNGRNLDLGTTQTHTRVGDVVLPPWASSPADFVRKHREALESEHVSAHLHEWIDLIFGYKQQGDEAIKANNLFYYLSYEGSVDLETITDPVEKCSFEAQIQEFGQTPKLLFAGAHPARSDIGRSVQVAVPAPVLSPRKRPASDASLATDSTADSSSIASLSSAGHNTAMISSSSAKDTGNPYEVPDDATAGYARKSMFGFRGRSIGVPLQAQRLVGGITAQFRRRLSTDAPRRWGWTFSGKKLAGDAPFWAGSSPFKLHSGEVTSLVLARDGRALFSTAKDTTFKVSATLDGSVRRNLSCRLALSCCDVSPDEKFVFIGSWDSCLYMYSVDVGRVIDQVSAHDDALSGVCVLDDRVLTSSWDGSLKTWHYTPAGLTTAPLAVFTDCDESVLALSVSADGGVAAAGTRSGAVYLVDLRTNELLRKLAPSPLRHAAVADVTFCGGVSTVACVSASNELSLYTLEGNRLAAIDVKSDGTIQCLESDGEFAIGGSTTGKLLFWKLDEPTGKELVFQISNAHAVAVSALAVSANGAALVSAAIDGSVRIWRLKRKTAARGRLPGFFS